VFVRLVLLIVLAVAVVTGAGGSADIQMNDSLGAVVAFADGEPMDAQDPAPAWIPDPIFFETPLVLSGTEVAHPSPEMARVFRPPRGSFA